jgi:hypothetical protein
MAATVRGCRHRARRGGAAAPHALGLSGEVARREFVPLYAKGARPDGGYLGRRFRLPEEADAAKKDALLAASEITDPYERWMARHEIRRAGGRASVAAWDCTFSPPKSVSLLWAAGDLEVQRQVWAAHVAAVDAGLRYLQEHAGYVRAGAQGVRVLDTTGLVVARMNEWTSRDGDMHLHTHCVILNRAQTVEDGKWRALDGRALLTARTGAGALYQRSLEAELTRRLGVAWRDRPDGLRELDGVDDELIVAFSSRRRAITSHVQQLAGAYRDKYGADPPPAVLNAMGQTAWATTRRHKQTPTRPNCWSGGRTPPASMADSWLRCPTRSSAGPARRRRRLAVGGEVDRLLARLAEGVVPRSPGTIWCGPPWTCSPRAPTPPRCCTNVPTHWSTPPSDAPSWWGHRAGSDRPACRTAAPRRDQCVHPAVPAAVGTPSNARSGGLAAGGRPRTHRPPHRPGHPRGSDQHPRSG